MIEYSFGLLRNAADLAAVNRLLQQLSKTAKPATRDSMREVHGKSHLILARDTASDGVPIVGMATLAPVIKPSRREGRIEDVVVDEKYRGKGIARELCVRLLEHAKAIRFTHVELTSAPHREAANQLYLKLGFEKRDTNVYRFKL